MKLADSLSSAATDLRRAGIESARLDALLLIGHVLEKDKAWLLANPQFELDPNNLKKISKVLERRQRREPLAYIVGHKEFYGLDFKVTPAVLIPRPETEAMVEAAISSAPRRGSVLEVGTGSGCVAVALKAKRQDLVVMATDISKSALKIAKQNAKANSADIKFVLNDLFNRLEGRFDLILANLPYVPTGVRRQAELDYEPPVALFAGNDGLACYRRFMVDLPDYLSQGGRAIIEAGPTQRSEIKRIANDSGLKLTNISEYVAILKV